MARSMTAYGRAVGEIASGLSCICEVHSVNRKHFDLHLHLAKEFLFLDVQLRQFIGKVIKRGKVTVKISFQSQGMALTPPSLLKQLKQQWISVARELGYDPSGIDLPFLLERAGEVSLEKQLGGDVQQGVETVLKEALDAFGAMKETEGGALVSDIEKRLAHLSTCLEKIEMRSKGLPEAYRKRLIEKLEALLHTAGEDERVLREVALFAEKIDITEEIVRLRSHIAQMREVLQSKEKSVGRTLEFLIQEMAREMHTIGSKSQDLALIEQAMEGKGELEKVREQVQNIE